MWKIVRTADAEYELRDTNGDVVATYEQTKMRHPNGWITDAVANGAEGWSIQSGNWEFIDERDQ